MDIRLNNGTGRFPGSVLLAMLIASSIARCLAEGTEQFATCAAIKDNRERLRCYDELWAGIAQKNRDARTKEAPTAGYQRIELIDLKTDIKSLNGKKVVASGLIQVMGEMGFLKSEAMDMSPVMVNWERLPRAERKLLLEKCNGLCDGQISGTVRNGIMGGELVAERLILR